MNTSKTSGKKHRLLFYRHTMDRLWKLALLLDVVLWLGWWYAKSGEVPPFQPPDDIWLLGAAIFVLFFVLFTFLVRNMGFVQTRKDHLLLATPFFRLKVSYRRIVSVRPVEFRHLYEIRKLSWANQRFLRPYFGRTLVAVSLKGYPMSLAIMKVFLPAQFFNPRETGFLFLVPDWMSLSTEVDSFIGAWRQGRAQKSRPQGPNMRGLYGRG